MNSGGPRFRPSLLEFGPLALTLLTTGTKVIAFDLFLRSVLYGERWPLAALITASASLAPILFVLSPLLMVSRAPRFAAFLIFDLVITTIVLANLLHVRRYHDVLSLSNLPISWQLGSVYQSALALLRPWDVVFLFDILLAIVAFPWYMHRCRSRPAVPSTHRHRIGVLMLVVALLAALLTAWTVWLDTNDVFSLMWQRSHAARAIGLLNYHLYETGEYLLHNVALRARVSTEDRRRVRRLVDERRPRDLACSSLFGVARNRNLIVLMVESLQAFPVGLRINGNEIMPHINALARRSLYFSNFYDQTGEATTSDAEFSSLNSLHPLPAGSVATRFPLNDYRALPKILNGRGYATISAHAYHSEFWNMRHIHSRLGFQRSYFAADYEMTEQIGLGLADEHFFRQTLSRVEAQADPFFAFLMTLTSHHPYRMPDRYATLHLADLTGTPLGDYLHAMHYVDRAIGEFVDRLARNGLLERSVLVIYGDHRNYIEDTPRYAELLSQYTDLTPPNDWKVKYGLPFLIHLPNDEAAGRRGVTGGHLDIAPTLLSLLGIENEGFAMLGRDLTRGENSLVVLRNGAFTDGSVLLTLEARQLPAGRCHGFESGRRLDATVCLPGLREARLRLEISDLVIRGNMIRHLTPPTDPDD